MSPGIDVVAPPTPFAVRVSGGRQALITVTGELDLATVPVLAAALCDVDFSSGQNVILDLERLDFIDAVGLRAVMALHERCLRLSATLTILPGPRRVHRVFELTGADALLPFRRR